MSVLHEAHSAVRSDECFAHSAVKYVVEFVQVMIWFSHRKDYKAMFFKSLKQVRETKEGEELKKVSDWLILGWFLDALLLLRSYRGCVV